MLETFKYIEVFKSSNQLESKRKMALGDYVPKPPAEKYHYDELWKSVSPEGADISGRKAVEFLRMSAVDTGILKQIWGLSTPTSTMNQNQFNSSLRYITMVQNGEIPISKGW